MAKSLTSDQKVAVNELLIEYDRLSNNRGRYRFGKEVDFEAQVLETKFYDLINTHIMAKKTKKVKAPVITPLDTTTDPPGSSNPPPPKP